MNVPVLSLLVFLPVAGACVVALMPRREGVLRGTALVFVFATLLVAGAVFSRFPTGAAGFAFVERAPWIPALGIGYHLGIDGISLLLVLLTALLFFAALVGTWDAVRHRLKEYLALLLLLEGAILGTFLALDLVLFYVFWEAVLIPMYFLIGIWGAERRSYAAIKFFLFTMAGSVFMLLAIIGLYRETGTFDLVRLYELGVPSARQPLLFAAFALAFAIKVPVFPLHTWLPDAHTEAPTAGSVILAGVLLKMGTYGLVRFCLPLFPEAAEAAAPWMVALGLVGIVYGAAVAFAQADVKRLVAYSSVSHLGFVVLGTFVFTLQGLQGALLQMVNHGLSTGALFLIVGILYERAHTRSMEGYGGVAKVMPTFAALSLIVVFSSAALPGTAGFVGEFLILLGALRADWRFAAVAAVGVVLSAVYLLWMVQKIYFGPVRVEAARFVTLRWGETLALVVLVAAILWIGLYPAPLLNVSEPAAAGVLERVEATTRSMSSDGSP
ncbi:MAG: NADH-quinone oxidoreductase subunit M [Armatimonadota bacterium]|nr:NADH-quinone oxidoreductase subunit M [Armatimonadota bacterium]